VVLQRWLSPNLLEDVLQRATEGKYWPHGAWSQRELDVAFLAYVSAGPQFADTLACADGYATKTTIHCLFHIP
jgi:hypothetical protein